MVKIIDYKAGNAQSVLHAVLHLGHEAALARRPEDLAGAAHIMLPGVGSAKATMESLAEMNMLGTLEELVVRKKILFLGICVGLQVLFEHSEEGGADSSNGDSSGADCLGWLKGSVVKFDASKVRVPQMGWNQVRFVKTPLSKSTDDYYYFVNSFYAKPENSSDVWGEADYNGPFAAAVCRDNIYATQFHIEKSGRAGLALLDSFLGLKGQS